MPRLPAFAAPKPDAFHPHDVHAYAALPFEFRTIMSECHRDGPRLLTRLERALSKIADQNEKRRLAIQALLSVGMKMREESAG